jgi:hypothetical protein
MWFFVHVSVDKVNVMAAYQPVMLACTLRRLDRDWSKGCAEGRVVCRPSRRVGSCRWPVVQRSVYCVYGVSAYIVLPSSSYSCLLYMVLVVLRFLLLGQTRVYCWVCALHMQIWGCSVLYIRCVPCSGWLLVSPIDLHKRLYMCCIWVGKFHSVQPPQCAHANTTGWYAAITLTMSTLTCTKNHIHSLS